MLNKGSWGKLKDVRLRSRVDLACWPCSPGLKVSFIEAEKWACSLIPVSGQSPGGMNTRWLCTGSRLFWMTVRCPWLTDRQQQAQCSAPGWKKATMCRLTDNREVLNISSSEKDFLGHLFLLTAWVRGWGCVHGNRESCSVPAVFIALCLWEKMFPALHKASGLPVAASCCFSAQWPYPQSVPYTDTCWIHLLGFLCWPVSYLGHPLPVAMVAIGSLQIIHSSSLFLQFPSCIQVQGISKPCDDQGWRRAGALGTTVDLGG